MPPYTPPKLSIMTFPQQWDGSNLSFAVLLLPSGNPLAPLFPGGAPFAGTPVALSLTIQPGLDDPFDFDDAAKVSLPVLPVQEHAVDLFTYFRDEAGITIQSNLNGNIRQKKLEQWGQVKKVLPGSYQLAAGAVNPNTPGVISEKEYACNLRGQERAVKPTDAAMNTLSWGQVISYVLKQPRLSRQMGLIYDFDTSLVTGLDADSFKNGGWLYVSLDPSMANPTTGWLTDSPSVSSFGARLPRLTATPRRVFAAVLFPSDDTELHDLRDDINREAREYDDGFTAIVHCRQPEKADAVTEYGEHLPAASEAGIQIGWDDEQVMTWLNRQLDNARASLDDQVQLVKAPLGVAGYRIDVRQEGETDWKSLCGVQLKKDARSKALQKVTLTLEEIEKIQPTSAGTFGDLTLEEKEKIQPLFPGEFNVDTTPIRPYGVVEAMMHLPRYFANWRGNSLVVPDEDAIKLTKPKQTKPTDSQPQPTDLQPTDLQPPEVVPDEDATKPKQPQPSDWQADLSNVPPLRYGQTYEFRVRLADLTGGGPSADDTPVNPALAPVATQEFQRHVPPKAMIVQKVPELNPERLMIRRPLLGYPELMYADVDNTYYSAAMIEELANNMALQKANGDGAGIPDPDVTQVSYGVGIPDPDVTQVSLRVQVRAPRHDLSGTQLRRDGEFIELYEVRYDLPAPDGFPFTSQVFSEEPWFQINLNYVECQDIEAETETMAQKAAGGTLTLQIPRGRDVRLRLAAVSQAGHFAKSLQSPKDKGLTYGLVSYVSLRREEMDPIGILFDAGVKAEGKACAILLQPANPQGAVKADPVQLVATALGLEAKGVTLTARPGQRVVFGASERLRHSLDHGNSEITFASKDELYHHWVVAIIIRLNRDWSWDGLKDRVDPDEAETHHGIEFQRKFGGGPFADVGRITIPQTLGEMATQPLAEQERSYTRIIFLDAIDPNPASLGEVPPYLTPTWQCTASVKGEATGEITPRTIKLPIAVPPVDLPKIAAAGIARPDYLKPAEDYATTEPMPRSLWIEFEKPLKINKDKGLKYFCRVLGYGADPLITPQPTWGFAGVPEPTKNFSSEVITLIRQWFGYTPEPPPLPLDPEEIRVIRPGQDPDSAGYDAMVEMIPAAETKPAEGEKDWLQPTKGVIDLLQPIGVKHWLLPLPPGVPPDSPELFGFWTYEIRVGYGKDVWSTARARFGRPLHATGVQHPPPQIACTAYRSAEEDTLVWLNPEVLISKLEKEAQLSAEIMAKLAIEMAAPMTTPVSAAGNRDLLGSEMKLKNLTAYDPMAGALGSSLLGMGPGRIRPAKPFVTPEDWIQHHLIGGDIVVTAPFALSIIDGKPMTYALTLVPGDDKWDVAQLQTLPLTHLWALLYTQVQQVDGRQKRNLLLTYKPMHFAGDPEKAIADPGQWFGRAIFKRTEVEGQLQSLGLGKEAPLSVLVLELLPNDAMPKQPKPGLTRKAIPNFEPLGKDLGRQRILRTSPLTQVADRC